MRSRFSVFFSRWTVTLVGLVVAIVAVAAYPLGLDDNPGMGPRRIALLAVGTGIVLLAQARVLRYRSGWDPPSTRPPAPPGEGPTEDAVPGRSVWARRGFWLLLSLMSLAILVSYVWLDGAGSPAHPPKTTFYYDMLADAFASGQTSLKAVPDPRLRALSNPYDAVARSHIPHCLQGRTSDCLLFDATYYDGKYYLYWGPAPAALLVPLKWAGVGPVGDNTLALVAAAFLFAGTAALLAQTWNRFFRHLPIALLVPPLILAGLAYPLPWVLDAPRIYEASVLFGAGFLMAGLVAAFPVLAGRSGSERRLLLAGVLWGLAFASRAVMLFPVAAFSTVVMLRLWKGALPTRVGLGGRQAERLAIPIVVSLCLIGLYNFVRFSSPFEFGWRFQLGEPAVQAEGPQAAFRPANIPVNLYNYVFAQVSLTREPPYLRPVSATRTIGRVTLPHPAFFYGELVTGLALATPFLLFIGFCLWWLISGPAESGGPPSEESPEQPRHADLRWLLVCLVLGACAAWIPILTFYAVTARYLLDASPLLLALAGIGSWIAYAAATTRVSRVVTASAIAVTTLLSAAASV
ncbi:MAG TPA: hypothetical protein VK449_07065, partial [Anaerolineales bacterium]|nr:hypothetical protein [Anaerolineales bacterium]